MTKKTFANNLVYYLFCGFSGAVISAIVWLFLKLMSLGVNLIWEEIPSHFDFPYYPMVVCTIGGVIIGIYQVITKAVPDELDEVMLKVKRDKFYPYNQVFLLCISALLPLLFGGSIGPEAGLTGVIVGLCYWAGSHMKSAQSRIPDLMQTGISATLSAIFYAPLFGLAAANEERLDSEEKSTEIYTTKMISNIIAVLFAIGMLFLLNTVFGSAMGLPRIGGYEITNTERLWGIPLTLLGAAFGLLFIISSKLSDRIFNFIKGKFGTIISTTLGGIILGVAGTYLPLVMFSGEESINEVKNGFNEFAPWILVISGALKLIVTNICIKSGWKGGHFFPVIFCGVSIGYGVALLSGLDVAFCAAVITAGLLGVTMKKPLAVTFLLLLCFDVRIIPWILLAAFIGSLIPNGFKRKKNLPFGKRKITEDKNTK